MDEWAPLAKEIGTRLEPSRAFFEEYTGLKGQELISHIQIARARAYEFGKYPCVGWWAFLKCALAHLSIPGAYEKAVSKVREGGVVIDIGAGLGQEMRRLALDAGILITPECFWATDLRPDLWNSGKFMFRDDPEGAQPTPSGRVMGAHMVAGDIFSEETQKKLAPIYGRTQVIIAFNFFHLFRLAPQEELGCLVARLAAPGSIILGTQVGAEEPEEFPTPEGAMYLHNRETWAKMWELVGERTGTRWRTESEVVQNIHYFDEDIADRLTRLLGENSRLLEFAVERIS